MVSPTPDRGYAHADIFLGTDEELDIEKAAGFLCDECLKKVLDTCFETPYGVGLINFTTNEIHLFEWSIRGGQYGDYYVSYTPREKNGIHSSTEINLIVFYCPERYQ